MSKVKKVFAIILSMAMILGMSLTAFADSIVGNSDDVGNIVVRGVEAGLTVKAYPIAMAEYDQTNGNFTGYSNPFELDDIENPTQEELVAINIATFDADKIVEMKQKTAQDDSIYYEATDVPVGMYLVYVTGSESVVYNVAVVSVNYVTSNGATTITPGDVTMVQNGSAWVKKSNVPTVTKVVSDESGNVETKVKGDSVDIGDNVTYEVTVSPIPNYGGNYPVLLVEDTLSTGLSYVDGSLVVKIGNNTLTAGTDYTVSVVDQKITVNFVVNNVYKLNDYTGESAVITYNARLNSSANVAQAGNNNHVVLTYSKDSKVDNNNGTDDDTTYTYTFDIDGETTGTLNTITKVGEGEDEDGLVGAQFTVYTDENCTTEDIYTNSEFNGTVTTDANGQMYIKGLAAGTYYLKETYAPAGYSINTHVFKLEIVANHNAAGVLTGWEVKIDDTTVKTFTVDNEGQTPTGSGNGFEIENTKLSSLPSTGGIGTTIFTVGGCAIMIAAAGLYFASRRKQENK